MTVGGVELFIHFSCALLCISLCSLAIAFGRPAEDRSWNRMAKTKKKKNRHKRKQLNGETNRAAAIIVADEEKNRNATETE